MNICYDVTIACSRWMALDTNKQIIYVLNQDHLTQIPLNGDEKIVDYFPTLTNYKIVTASQMIVLNGSLFVIGGHNDNNSILKWNERNKCFTKVASICTDAKLFDFGLIQYKHKHNKTDFLLLFGGRDCTRYKTVDSIFEFDIKNEKCSKLDASLPNAHYALNCTFAIHNKYVLLFCCYTDIIYIYSIKDKRIRESKVKAPSKPRYGFKCMTVNDDIKDEKIVFGYLRNGWKIGENKDLLFLIHSFCGPLNEFVFIIDTDNRKHYKRSTSEIV